MMLLRTLPYTSILRLFSREGALDYRVTFPLFQLSSLEKSLNMQMYGNVKAL